jgi:hypothetical protein
MTWGGDMNIKSLSPVVLPICATVYALYRTREQLTGAFKSSTVWYVTTIGAIIVLLAIATAITELRKARSGAEVAVEEGPTEDSAMLSPWEKAGRLLFLLSAVIIAVLFQHIGYIIGFSSLLLIGLLVLGVRSWKILLFVPLSVVVVVHYLFVKWLSLPLPAIAIWPFR